MQLGYLQGLLCSFRFDINSNCICLVHHIMCLVYYKMELSSLLFDVDTSSLLGMCFHNYELLFLYYVLFSVSNLLFYYVVIDSIKISILSIYVVVLSTYRIMLLQITSLFLVYLKG